MNETRKEYSKETIRLQITDLQGKAIEGAEVELLGIGPKSSKKIILPNKTDSNGEVMFDSKKEFGDINRFEIRINHKDFYAYPKNRSRKVCKSYEYGHLCMQDFIRKVKFYFDEEYISISQYPNSPKSYKIQILPNPTQSIKQQVVQEEYYIKLETNKEILQIYKDSNLTQNSDYALYLQLNPINSASKSSNQTTEIYFNDKDSLKSFQKEIETIIELDGKKNIISNYTHKFIISNQTPDLIAKALQMINEFENRNVSGVFLDERLGDEEVIRQVVLELDQSRQWQGWKERLHKLKQYKDKLFEKEYIISTLRERVINLTKPPHNYTTQANIQSEQKKISDTTNSLYPDQGPTSLCGPATFFYCLLLDRPDLYVKCVIDLWERGEANIKNLHIKPSEDCKNPYSLIQKTLKDWADYINGVDWITLASLRDSENSIFDYDEADDKIAGITFEGELKSWFIKVGAELLFSNITYGLHINKNKLLQLVEYKQKYPQSHIISLINSGVLYNGDTTQIKGKNHWIVWNTSPQDSSKDIDSNTSDTASITQQVVSWGEINQNLTTIKIDEKNSRPPTLREYLEYQFGAMVFLPIPYELGESE
ncbi:hypothetical protein [Helicobacter didelphidarum]|uniref:hypothetical protein n=1 Tax=Helicobacter didelphidarum TaxID=2040648 RepID=UPI001FE89396|nr:hypothetical protein [Helicobacter didelphidarum]